MQKPYLRRCLSLMLTVISVDFAVAEQAMASENLPPLTIIAPQPPLEDEINNPQHLDEAALSVAHERTVTDILTGLPSITTGNTGGFGQVGSVFVRGAGGQGLITLDDMPLLQSVPGYYNLNTLPSEALESAEIERGVGAAYRPFQALGGAIRLYTRDSKDTAGKLSVEGGSFGILRETLQGSVAGSQSRITATVNRADAFDGSHLADDHDHPERDPSHFTQGILRFSSELGTRLNWQGSMLYRNSGTGIDAFAPKGGILTLVDDRNSHAYEETWLAQNSLSFKAASNWQSRLQLGYTQLSTRLNIGPLINGVFTRLYLADWRNDHVLIDDEAQKTQWRIIWGGQGRHEQGESENRGFSQSSQFSQERTLTSGYIHTLGRYGKLSAETGARIESYDRFGNHVLFKSAAAWKLTPDLTLRASGGTGYRIPSYTELLFLISGNPLLKPERSSGGDAGLEWYPVQGMKITLNGYYQRYHDLITPVYDRFRGPIALNIADASMAGMELSGEYAWTESVDTGLSYSFSDNQNLSEHRLLPLRPAHTARIWGQKTLAALPLTLWAEAVVRSATWNDVANTLPVKSSVQINAVIRYALSQQLELYLRGENLTNNRNSQNFGTNMPGAAVYGGFKVNF